MKLDENIIELIDESGKKKRYNVILTFDVEENSAIIRV